MKARIIEQPAMVYNDAGPAAMPIVQLPVGLEVELGGIKKQGGQTWVGVTLPNGQTGFLTGDVRIYHIKNVTLLQDGVNVYTGPSLQAPVAARFPKNAKFQITDSVQLDGATWVRIRDAGGLEGFIQGGTMIRVQQEAATATKALGGKNMLVGGLWCVGGTVVTVGSMVAAQGGGYYLVTWGAIVFGGIQFFRGLGQYMSAKY